MRVTDNTNYETVRDSIRRSRTRMEDLQKQSATLKKLNTPSDDPVGASKVLEVRTDKVNNDQFQLNAKMASTFLNNSDHALSELTEIVSRAKEIALNQASGPSSNDDTRVGVAEEVSQLFKQAVATANRRVGDRYLFGGYKTQNPPVGPEGGYLGDNGNMMVEIGKGVYITMNVPGHEAFNSNPSIDTKRNPGIYNEPSRAPAATDQDVEMPGKENVNVFDELQNL
ncbi:MAG: flagellar hook-associated protein FlgL, partial [Bdellovibrionota bacterium]